MDAGNPLKLEFDVVSAIIMDHATNLTKMARPGKLRKQLRELHDDAWDLEHREMLILLNCMARAVPARTHGNLMRLRKEMVAADDEPRFERLVQLIRAYLHPEFLTPHGYNTTFGQLDSEHIYNSMGRAVTPLAVTGLPIYIFAGALLGHIRNGKLIEHDDDIDVAMMLGDCAPDEVAPLWREVKIELDKLGLLTEESRVASEPVFKMKTDLGIVLDIFPSWTYEGKFSVYPYALDDLDQDAILPLTSFGQDPLMFPAKPEAFLEHCYGPNWRIPDPYFHLNWKKKNRIFKKLLSVNYALEPRAADQAG